MGTNGRDLVRVAGNLADVGAIVKFTADGAVQAVRATVTLERSRKHFYEMPGGGKDNKAIALTADGYYFLNRVAGVQIITPPTLWIDGAEQRNPVIQRDEAGNILAVVVRKIAFGRNMLGTYCAADSTLVFSPRAYFIRDIIKAVQGTWKNGQRVPNPDLGHIKPTAHITPEERQRFWVLDQGLGLSLLVNTGHEDFTRIFGTFQEVCLFAERRAQTICERMALSRHPAIATKTVVPDGDRVKVDLVAWQESDLSREEIRRRAVALSRGEDVRDAEVETQLSTVEDEEPIDVTPAAEAAPVAPPQPPQPALRVVTSEPEPPNSILSTPATPPAAEQATKAGKTRPAKISAPKATIALSDEERAAAIDELDAASNQMDETDWQRLCRECSVSVASSMDTLPDEDLAALRAAVRNFLK